MSTVREKIVKLRGEKSQADMAKIYETSQQNWFNWENGVSRPRDYSLMEKIANDAGGTVSEIFFAATDKENLSAILT